MSSNAAIEMSEETRQNLSKFVYFLFGITTLSLGYFMQSTHKAIPDWRLILWGQSTVSMVLSLACGTGYLYYANKYIGHASMVAGWIWYTSHVSQIPPHYLKEWIKNYSEPPHLQDTVGRIRFTLHSLLENPSSESINSYIDSIPDGELQARLLKFPYEKFGKKDQISELKDSIKAGNTADKWLMGQVGLFVAGGVFYLLYHISTFNWAAACTM